MTLEKKFRKNYSPDQLAGYLRQLAAQIDGSADGDTDESGDRMDNIKSLALKIKRHPTGYSVKFKVKPERTDGSDFDDTVPVADTWGTPVVEFTFKHLKKRMKFSFKSIDKHLVVGSLPNKAVVVSFLEDADRMSRFPEQCGERYAEFKKACDGLLHAFDNADLDALQGRYADLKRLRNECHRNKS